MRILSDIFLITTLSLVLRGETIGRAEYVGGTVDSLHSGAGGDLHTGTPALIFQTRQGRFEIPYDRVNLLEYGQNASRRIVLAVVVSPMFLLSKSRRHFVTVGFRDEEGHQQAMVLRIEKARVRAVLASLEARTGLRVQYQDDEARKAGKG